MRASRLVSIQEKIITDEMVEERIKELRPHHPVFAAILERVHEMNLRDSQCFGCFRRSKMAFKDHTLLGLRLLRKEETIITFDSFPIAYGKRLLYNEGKIY